MPKRRSSRQQAKKSPSKSKKVTKKKKTSIPTPPSKNNEDQNENNNEAEEDEDTHASNWQGNSLCTIDTDTYYPKYEYENETFSLGDCVYVNVADSSDYWVAVIESLWEDQYGEKWFEGRWFYDPTNAYGCSIRVAPSSSSFTSTFSTSSSSTSSTSSSNSSSSASGRTKKNNRRSRVIELPAGRELYESDHIDENTIETIAGKVSVKTAHQFRDMLEKSSNVPEDLFYCQCFYRTSMGMVRPILEQSTREQRAKLYGNRSILVNEAKRNKNSPKNNKNNYNNSQAPSPGTSSSSSSSSNSSNNGNNGNNGNNSTGNKRNRPTKRQKTTSSSLDANDDDEEERKTSAYSKACAALQLSAVPKSLPCREQEREEIMQFIRGGIQHGGLGCALYIAGKNTYNICHVML